MIVNTKRLFARLLSTMKIDSVCDVGSMDGADSLGFREAAPESSIYAFEANPMNFDLMKTSAELQKGNIRILPLAVTDHDGEAEFFIVPADYSRPDARRGCSSLYRRTGEDGSSTAVVQVRTTRLDTFITDNCPADARFALWIDAEGKAYEVIEGVAAAAQRIYLVHVEVETEPCIGLSQKLYPEVKGLLETLRFRELATDHSVDCTQFNALFARSDLPAGMQFQIRAWRLYAEVRHLFVGVILRICPGCIPRYHALRSRCRRAAS